MAGDPLAELPGVHLELVVQLMPVGRHLAQSAPLLGFGRRPELLKLRSLSRSWTRNRTANIAKKTACTPSAPSRPPTPLAFAATVKAVTPRHYETDWFNDLPVTLLGWPELYPKHP